MYNIRSAVKKGFKNVGFKTMRSLIKIIEYLTKKQYSAKVNYRVRIENLNVNLNMVNFHCLEILQNYKLDYSIFHNFQ